MRIASGASDYSKAAPFGFAQGRLRRGINAERFLTVSKDLFCHPDRSEQRERSGRIPDSFTRVGLLRVANACEAGTGLWIREALHFLTAPNVKPKNSQTPSEAKHLARVKRAADSEPPPNILPVILRALRA